MIAFDTDHLTVLLAPAGSRRDRLLARMASERVDLLGLPVVTLEEKLRGWLASVARERQASRQISPYAEMTKVFVIAKESVILPFDETAADHFDRIRPTVRGIGTMDLKIACCAIAADALLLTANRRDFERVPGLRFENWLD